VSLGLSDKYIARNFTKKDKSEQKNQVYALPSAQYWKWTYWQWRCKNGLKATWQPSPLYLVILLPIDAPLPLQRYDWRAFVIEVNVAEEWPFQRIAVQMFLRKVVKSNSHMIPTYCS